MKTPLNSPLEVGIRVLMLLVEAFPKQIDLNTLVLLDHGLLHSADLGGPQSLHPPLPIRAGELGMKRKSIEQGLEVLVRAELVEILAQNDGISFSVSENAHGFANLLTTEYAKNLRLHATWVIGRFGNLTEPSLRSEMRHISNHWSEEFEVIYGASAEGR